MIKYRGGVKKMKNKFVLIAILSAIFCVGCAKTTLPVTSQEISSTSSVVAVSNNRTGSAENGSFLTRRRMMRNMEETQIVEEEEVHCFMLLSNEHKVEMARLGLSIKIANDEVLTIEDINGDGLTITIGVLEFHLGALKDDEAKAMAIEALGNSIIDYNVGLDKQD